MTAPPTARGIRCRKSDRAKAVSAIAEEADYDNSKSGIVRDAPARAHLIWDALQETQREAQRAVTSPDHALVRRHCGALRSDDPDVRANCHRTAQTRGEGPSGRIWREFMYASSRSLRLQRAQTSRRVERGCSCGDHSMHV
jgi:hypothetical protein